MASILVRTFAGYLRNATLTVLLLAPAGAPAHDLITSDAAQRYLDTVARNLSVIRSRASVAERAEAHAAIGRALDEIRELLNRDLAVHGRVQGLPSTVLVEELKRMGAPLPMSSDRRRFLAPEAHFREALQLDPKGGFAGDAMYRWLRGSFYDSFDEDPLAPRGQDWRHLSEQITLAERFVARSPAHPEVEEGRFILLVDYVRAARSAPEASQRREFASKARTAAAEFEQRYPDSLRAAALPVLLQGLQ